MNEEDPVITNCKTCQEIKAKASQEHLTDNEYTDEESHLGSLSLNLSQSKVDVEKLNLRRQSFQQNKTFSMEKIREIERKNAMLVDRILYHNGRPNQYKISNVYKPKVTSSEINRRRHQEKIIRENEILLKKIQSVKPAVRYT
ncbi:hypothetical protein ABEB36_006120 [Hypothenemus hampei]|uniref:Uncharacterized protein n=1 Tax=Hypothenemus hampei TaxID=57062 RepID=A0ABD1F0N7_HYPHA